MDLFGREFEMAIQNDPLLGTSDYLNVVFNTLLYSLFSPAVSGNKCKERTLPATRGKRQRGQRQGQWKRYTEPAGCSAEWKEGSILEGSDLSGPDHPGSSKTRGRNPMEKNIKLNKSLPGVASILLSLTLLCWGPCKD